jgi:hypothetical protein
MVAENIGLSMASLAAQMIGHVELQPAGAAARSWTAATLPETDALIDFIFLESYF